MPWPQEPVAARVSNLAYFLARLLREGLRGSFLDVQLSLWALVSHDDVWLMANSIFWSTATIGLLIYAASRVYGLRAGLYSGILLALAPVALLDS